MTDESRIRSWSWHRGQMEAEDFSLDQASEYLRDHERLVWVDILNPDTGMWQELVHKLALDPLAVEDAINRHGRAKASQYGTHTFLTVYAIATLPNGQPLSTAPVKRSGFKSSRVSAFVLQHGIVTIRHDATLDIEEVVRRWNGNAELLKYGTEALVYGLLDVIVDSHFEAAQMLDNQMESLENQLFDDHGQSRQFQQRVYRVRKDLVELRRVVLPMREVVNTIMRHRQDIDASPELNSWYVDLYDHVLRASEWTESLRDMVTAVFETNLSLQDNRLNMVMKKLTAWAAIIAVPTAVTGYFGQNVPYPGYSQMWGFYESIAIIVGVATTLYVIFKRKDWL